MSLLPSPYGLIADLVMVGAAVVGIGFIGARIEHNSMQVKLDAVQHAWDAERVQESAAALAKDQEYRTKEQNWQTAIQENVNVSRAQLVTVATAAGHALDSAVGLRQRATTFATGGAVPAHSAASAGSAPISGPGLVLADLLGRTGEAAQRYAAEADRARVAGDACERWAAALTK
jgi:hypothetical protein